MLTREEHVKWCKERALEYLNEGDLTNAVSSMLSDLGKHAETNKLSETFSILGMMYVMNQDIKGVQRFIEGFY